MRFLPLEPDQDLRPLEHGRAVRKKASFTRLVQLATAVVTDYMM
jgi:hypothetical protein